MKTLRRIAWLLVWTLGSDGFAGSLSGRVTDATGTALANVFMDLYDAGGAYFDYTATDNNGNYQFANLGAGGFYVHTDTLGEYVEEWYDNVPGASADTFYEPLAAHATPVAVGYDATVTGVNIALARAGSLAGRITDANGAAAPGVYVDVYQPDGSRFLYDLTDADGYYTVTGLPAGSYAVRTDSAGAYLDRWHNQAPAFDAVGPTAAGVPPLAVTAGGQLAGIDIQMAVGGAIRGTLRTGTGDPVRGVYVDLLDASGTRLEFDRSDTNGLYELKGLPAGAYYLGTDALGAYMDLWYNQQLMVNAKQPALDGASPVNVPAGAAVPGVDFTLNAGAALSGRVAWTSGVAVTRGFVDVFLGTNFFDYGAIDASGFYTVGGLPDGTYRLKVDTLGACLDEWYDDVVILNPRDPVGDGATPVSVTNGLAVAGVDFALRQGAAIAGRVTDASAAAIAGVYVDLHDGAGRRRFYTRTGADGTYRLGGLPAGTLYLNTDTEGQYADEWFDNRPVISYTNPVADGATALTVALGESRDGVNLQLRAGGALTGKATTTNAVLLVAATVNLYAGNRLFARSTTDSNGVYRIGALPAGTYYARVDAASGFLGEWYRDIQVLAADDPVGDGATAVVVADNATRTGIDFELGTGGGLSGTVRTTEGTPIALTALDLFDSRGRYYDSAVSLANGTFALSALPPGGWFLGTDTVGAYADEWFDNVARTAFVDPAGNGATRVTIVEGGAVTANFLLALQLPDPVVLLLLGQSVFPPLVTWQAEASQAYQVERRADLRSGKWENAPSGAGANESSFKAAGAAGLRQYRDPAAPTRAVYRVRSL